MIDIKQSEKELQQIKLTIKTLTKERNEKIDKLKKSENKTIKRTL